MISKEEYTLSRVKAYLTMKAEKNEKIHSQILQELIEQWEFDYKVEEEYRPEILKKEKELDN